MLLILSPAYLEAGAARAEQGRAFVLIEHGEERADVQKPGAVLAVTSFGWAVSLCRGGLLNFGRTRDRCPVFSSLQDRMFISFF